MTDVSSLVHQLPQHVGKNPAVAERRQLFRGIDSDEALNFSARAVGRLARARRSSPAA